MNVARILDAWRALPAERRRLVLLACGGTLLALVVYVTTSGIVALAVAAVVAYFVGRLGQRSKQADPEATTAPSVERPRPPQRRVRPAPQTPIGRLFAERPTWSGSPADPFEPPPRPARRMPAEDQEPYDRS